MALRTDKFDKFILLQGADYPLYSPKIIHEFLDRHKDEEFCKSYDISDSVERKHYMKIAGFHVFDGIANPIYYVLNRFFVFFNSFGIKYRSCYFKCNGTKWHIYHGWAQWCLSYSCIKFIYDFYNKSRKYNAYFKHRFPPDELYFQTLIQNSPFKNKLSVYTLFSAQNKKESTNLNLTYFEYPKYVRVFSQAEELDTLKRTGALFIRKVDSDKSVALLNRIDDEKTISFLE